LKMRAGAKACLMPEPCLASSAPSSGAPPLKPRTWLKPTLALASGLALCTGGVFYWRPWRVLNELIRARLRLAGVGSEYVQLGPFRIHYRVGGRGKPLVLVHGLGATAESWAGPMTALIRRGYRVYAIDLLGFGRSDCPDVDYSITLQTQILEQFFDSQNLASADLGGWSMGGWVALKFALTLPDRVRRLFVVDSAGLTFELPFGPAVFQPATVEDAQRLLMLLTPYAGYLPRFMARDLIRYMRPTRWVVQRAMQSMMWGGDLLDDKLQAMRVPVLVVWGKQDRLIPSTCGEEMHRQMPHSRFVMLDGCGHMLPVEGSRKLVAEIVRFLAQEQGSGQVGGGQVGSGQVGR